MVSPVWSYLKASMRALVSFRGSFLISGISMTLTNMMLFLPLYFLSAQYNGFGVLTHELVTMGLAISLLSYTIGINFTSGIVDLQEIILSGELDKLLLRPISVYKHLLIYRINSWMLGEVIGSIILLLLNPISSWPIIILLGISGGILFNHIAILANISPLFVRQDREHSFWETIIAFSIYPPTLFPEFGRIISLYILPGAMTAYGGILILIDPSYSWIYFGFIALIVAITHLLLHFGIRKYTSAGY